ncbi:hypothetical protein N7519_002170 [Penicillium mononematosum]|uniref:uncharacterized protein n=1 Tax=Penicillium mononematosum TaxID=268346 RepID=UPI002547DF0B|nr:uncharacterized protein N7519_002170 [Penicillium mononematosum]KAJ6187262.1 hypothetical protein N7519_002170 [Penicillium mononematosum]
MPGSAATGRCYGYKLGICRGDPDKIRFTSKLWRISELREYLVKWRRGNQWTLNTCCVALMGFNSRKR